VTLARHLMVDFNQMKTFVEDPLVLDQGAGIRVTDTCGRTYIDGLSGVFTSNLGHANREIIDAVTAQLGRLAFGAPTMATTSTALTLVDRMLEFAPPQYTTMKFLSGGSEATESAMKLARQYHRQTGHAGRYKILSHYRGYHGGTGHALAASGWPTWKIPFEPMAPGFVHLQTPDPDSTPAPVADPEAAARLYLELVRQTIEFEGPQSIAAIIT
jgi:adenosylmethionine-8-amino-7-oxononanoate aminotransferase